MKVFVKRIEKGKLSPKKRFAPNSDFLEIDVMTSSTSSVIVSEGKEYNFFELSPYSLCDENGIIVENLWQFSKVFSNPKKVSLVKSKWDSTVIWEYSPKTSFYDKNVSLPTEEWWDWRNSGFYNCYPIRYPNSYKERKKVEYSYWSENYSSPPSEENVYEKLNYISSRKKIYLPIYCDLIEKLPSFLFLKEVFQNTNIIIREVDGPHFEDISYYTRKYSDIDKNLENKFTPNGLECDIFSLAVMLNDSRYSFGHGYCLAAKLLEIDEALRV